MSKILITGANGFVGKSLLQNLILKKKYFIHLSSRTAQEKTIDQVSYFNVGDIDSKTNWKNALYQVDCVIHCAAKVHVMGTKQKDLLNIYRRVNIEGTKNLAEQAASLGIKRFIFLSSIKVNGERTKGYLSFRYSDNPQPEDAYGISKFETELALKQISKKTGLEIVVIRAPLVYGPGVKGNFLRLLDLVYRKTPLPFAKINNLRSFVSIDNLTELIIRCIDHPKAAEKIFLASDNEDVSTPDLIIKLSKFMNKTPRLFPIPVWILQLMGQLSGKSLEVERLTGSLRIDISDTHKILGWSPFLSLNEGLEKVVKWYLRNR
jgi:nucleoside-diphosphate-sugar epimerase